MLKTKIQDALNEQFKWEFYSAYLYLSMSSYLESINLSGFANWMYVQFQEEQEHAMRIFRYVNERGGRALLSPIEGPPTDWKSSLDAFEVTCEHEAHVTRLIDDLMDLAIEEKDHATTKFLQWFVEEQVEEEANCGSITQKMKLAGDGGGLFMIDQELGQRVFVPSADMK